MPSGHDHQPLPDDSDASSTRSSIDGAVQEVNSEDDTGEGTSYDRPQNPILGRWPQILVATAVMALFAVVAWLFYLHIKPSPPLEPPGKPIPQIKVMIVGDSITQGYEGDYTWHYRIWQWFRDSPDTNIAFVGPYPGTFPPPDAPLPPSPQPTTPGLDSRTWGGYARDVNPAFLSGNGHMHFAAWGRQFAQFKHVVEDEVRAHQPDYLLVALGFNDIAWLYHPWEAIQSFKTLVANARKAKPDLRFAVANVPQRTFTPGRKGLPAATDEYNALLEVAIRELDSEESPFALARLREGYACDQSACPAAHDGLHPNALGEYQIARAFSQALHLRYGLGSGNLTIPSNIPPRPCATPKNVTAVTSFLKANTRPIAITWNPFYGAFGYYVQARPRGLPWRGVMFTDRREYKIFWAAPGQEWEMRVQTYCGDTQDNSAWSEIVRAKT